MLAEAIDGLAIHADGCYVDCTFGRGGHSAAIMERLSEKGRLLGLDKDRAAVASPEAVALAADGRFRIEHASFAALSCQLESLGWRGRVDGVLMDLGVSSPQLDEADRGFSFMRDGPLDMRMDRSGGLTAAEWIAQAGEKELEQVVRDFGEERYARRIAGAVVRRRVQQPIVTTSQLAAIVAAAIPRWERGQHPATRTFQAIRIHVNRELLDLEQGLMQAVDELRVGGRLVAISFHSLEDRIVKRLMRREQRGGRCDAPWPAESDVPRLKRIGRAQRPGEEEIQRNPRARSAVLRVAERVAP